MERLLLRMSHLATVGRVDGPPYAAARSKSLCFIVGFERLAPGNDQLYNHLCRIWLG
jgi:hypothetical protein